MMVAGLTRGSEGLCSQRLRVHARDAGRRHGNRRSNSQMENITHDSVRQGRIKIEMFRIRKKVKQVRDLGLNVCLVM